MPPVVADVIFAGVVASVGACLGWWLRGGSHRAQPRQADEEAEHARAVLSRLHDLAVRVAADVGEHSSRVEEINEELAATETHEAEAVMTAVDKLVQANTKMQQQLASAEERLEDQARQIKSHAAEARTDVLTGLANRRAFDGKMARCFDEFQGRGRIVSLVMIDVDRFKKFNDTHGHQAGDDVLRGVASVLRRNARDDALPARYGGEEFAVILPGTPVTQAMTEADRLRQKIETTDFHFGKNCLRVTVSVGVAQLMVDEEAVALIERADAALYASKQTGRNCTHWHDGETTHLVEREPAQTHPDSQPAEPQPLTPEPQGRSAEASQPPPEPPAEKQAAAESDRSADAPGGQQQRFCDRDTFCTVLDGRLAEWRRGGQPPSVLLIHIDSFQGIIASGGRLAGGRVLRATMQFLGAAIRDMDLVAHYEAASFALLLPGAGLANAIQVAERLRQAVARCRLSSEGVQLQFTVSVGGAEATSGDDSHRLLARTQEALSAAVKSGGNCSYFHNGHWSETASSTLERAKEA